MEHLIIPMEHVTSTLSRPLFCKGISKEMYITVIFLFIYFFSGTSQRQKVNLFLAFTNFSHGVLIKFVLLKKENVEWEANLQSW